MADDYDGMDEDLAAVMGATHHGTAVDHTIPDAETVLEFDSLTIEQAKSIEKYSFLTRFAAFCQCTSKGSYEFMSKPPTEWTTTEFVRMSQCAVPLTMRGVTPGLIGTFEKEGYAKCLKAGSAALMCTLQLPKTKPMSSQTDGTLYRDLAIKLRGTTVERVIYEGKAAYEVKVPGFVLEKIPFIVDSVDGNCGRVIAGGAAFVDWYNAQQKAQIRYKQVDPLIVHLAAYLHRVIILAGIASNGEIIIKERPRLDVKNPFIHRVEKWGTQGEEKSFNDVVRTLQRRFVEEYNHHPDMRPSWVPTAKATQISVLEWTLDNAFKATLLNKVNSNRLWDFVNSARDECQRQVRDTLAALGPVGNGDFRSACVKIGTCALRYPGQSGIISNYVHINNVVETSRSQERSVDLTTRKVDSPGCGAAGLEATSVAAKIHNGLLQLASLFPDDWDASFRNKLVDACGTASEGHWQATLQQFFSPVNIHYYDINPAFAPVMGGTFIPRDVCSPAQTPAGCGRGRLLVSDVFPGKTAKDATFGNMMKVYLAADYDAGLVKLYMGTDLDGETSLSAVLKQAPTYYSEWLAKYASVTFAPGGGPHSQEYFLVFAGRRADGWQSSPPKTAVKSKPNPCVMGKELETRGEFAALSPDLLKGWTERYAHQWLLAKAIDILRGNAWKGPYAYNSAYPTLPKNYQEGLWFIEPLYMDGVVLHITGRLAESATTVDQGKMLEVQDIVDDYDM